MTCDETLNRHSAECASDSPVPTEPPPAPSKPERPKGGAPLKNKNAYRHGLRQQGDRGDRRLLVLPSSPPSDRWADRLVEGLRRKWEEAVIAQKGQLSRADEEAIQTAAKWELHSIRAGLWLKRDSKALTHAERMTASREVAEASERRDRALAKLGIDGNATPDADSWASFYAKQASAIFQAPTAPNALGANLVAHTGDHQEQKP